MKGISEKIRIAIVDDHVLFSSGLKMLMETQKDLHVVAVMTNAAEALQFLKSNEVNLVLMDITLPGMDGIKATRQIKESHPRVKVLILTMHDDEPYLLKALEAGAAGYILKEAASRELIGAIRSVVKGDFPIHPSLVKSLVKEVLREKPPTTEQDEQACRENILTEREMEVLQYICRGYTSREVAELLVISIKTAEKHKEHIMKKLNLKRRHELMEYALKHDLVNLKEESG